MPTAETTYKHSIDYYGYFDSCDLLQLLRRVSSCRSRPAEIDARQVL